MGLKLPGTSKDTSWSWSSGCPAAGKTVAQRCMHSRLFGSAGKRVQLTERRGNSAKLAKQFSVPILSDYCGGQARTKCHALDMIVYCLCTNGLLDCYKERRAAFFFRNPDAVITKNASLKNRLKGYGIAISGRRLQEEFLVSFLLQRYAPGSSGCSCFSGNSHEPMAELILL